jgi:hypothetical protein
MSILSSVRGEVYEIKGRNQNLTSPITEEDKSIIYQRRGQKLDIGP